MALYEYKCPKGHTLDHACDMGHAPAHVTCRCGELARRVFSRPMVGLMGYRAKTGRKRRANPGDGMYVPGDPELERVVRTL